MIYLNQNLLLKLIIIIYLIHLIFLTLKSYSLIMVVTKSLFFINLIPHYQKFSFSFIHFYFYYFHLLFILNFHTLLTKPKILLLILQDLSLKMNLKFILFIHPTSIHYFLKSLFKLHSKIIFFPSPQNLASLKTSLNNCFPFFYYIKLTLKKKIFYFKIIIKNLINFLISL
jgi:hypothetical protein